MSGNQPNPRPDMLSLVKDKNKEHRRSETKECRAILPSSCLVIERSNETRKKNTDKNTEAHAFLILSQQFRWIGKM